MLVSRGTVPTVEIMTSAGPAHVTVQRPAGRPALLAVLTHGAGGTPDTPDVLAVRDAARSFGAVTALVTQPYRVRGGRAPGSVARLCQRSRARSHASPCGARGRLGPDARVAWTDLTTSVISMDEKRAPAAEIQETAERHQKLRAEIEERAGAFGEYDRIVRPERAAPGP